MQGGLPDRGALVVACLMAMPADLTPLHNSPASELFRGRWRSADVVVKRFRLTANQQPTATAMQQVGGRRPTAAAVPC